MKNHEKLPEKATLDVTLTLSLNPKVVDDILTTAFEGGINYWCGKVTFAPGVNPPKGTYASEALTKGCDLILYDAEEPELWTLTLEKMLSGIKLYCEKRNTLITDDSILDAEEADVVVQLALFGEVVFG